MREATSAAIGQGTASGGPSGYMLVLPPGWRQVPVRAGTREVIREIVRDRFRVRPGHVPRDALTSYRIALEQQLRAAAAQARQRGGTELYLPVEPVRGTLIAASFVVSEGSIGARDEQDAALIVAALSGDGRGLLLDGVRAARIERIAPPDPARGVERGSRHVDYAVPVPGGDGRWLIFAFSALGAGDPGDELAGNLVQLFDAIMSTFRWTWSPAPENPP